MAKQRNPLPWERLPADMIQEYRDKFNRADAAGDDWASGFKLDGPGYNPVQEHDRLGMIDTVSKVAIPSLMTLGLVGPAMGGGAASMSVPEGTLASAALPVQASPRMASDWPKSSAA